MPEPDGSHGTEVVPPPSMSSRRDRPRKIASTAAPDPLTGAVDEAGGSADHGRPAGGRRQPQPGSSRGHCPRELPGTEFRALRRRASRRPAVAANHQRRHALRQPDPALPRDGAISAAGQARRTRRHSEMGCLHVPEDSSRRHRAAEMNATAWPLEWVCRLIRDKQLIVALAGSTWKWGSVTSGGHGARPDGQCRRNQ